MEILNLVFRKLSGNIVNRKILFAVSAGWLSKGIGIVVNLIQIPLIYKYLDKEIIGAWFLMIGAQMFTGIFDFGFGKTVERRLAFSKGDCGSNPDITLTEKAKQRIADLLFITRIYYRCISMLLFFVLVIMGLFYFGNLKSYTIPINQIYLAWIIMSLGYAANMWGWFIESTLNGLGDIGWSSAINSILWVAVLVSTWVSLAAGGGLIALAVIWAIRGVLLRTIGWLTIKRLHPWIGIFQGKWIKEEFISMIDPAIKWWLAILGYFFVNGISRYFIGSYLGLAAVPDYIATFTALSVVSIGITSIVEVTAPLQAQMWRSGDIARMRKYVFTLTRLGLILLTAVFTFVAFNGKGMFELWLGEGHFIGYEVLLLLIIMMFLEAHHSMLNIPCIAAEKLQFYKYSLLAGVLNLVLIPFLICRWGLLGVSLSILLAQLLTNNWVIPRVALRLLNRPFAQYLKDVILPVFFAALSLIAVMFLLNKISSNFIVVGVMYLFIIIGASFVFRKRIIHNFVTMKLTN